MIQNGEVIATITIHQSRADRSYDHMSKVEADLTVDESTDQLSRVYIHRAHRVPRSIYDHNMFFLLKHYLEYLKY